MSASASRYSRTTRSRSACALPEQTIGLDAQTFLLVQRPILAATNLEEPLDPAVIGRTHNHPRGVGWNQQAFCGRGAAAAQIGLRQFAPIRRKNDNNARHPLLLDNLNG